MEMKVARNLMRKLGMIIGDEAPSEAALEAYHRMFEAELNSWSLSTIRGCLPPLVGMSGGRLIEP
jgi:hypothetical protein